MKIPYRRSVTMNRLTTENPLKRLDDWDDFVTSRYQENKSQEEFRNYDPDANLSVAEFYRQNHTLQTFDFVESKEREYLPLRKAQKTIWQAAEFLNTLVDESDPDTDLTQIDHLLQASEAIRKDGHPRWFVLTGFVHDLGKALCLYGEPQWAVVATHFRWDALTPTRSSSMITSPLILIRRIPCIRTSTEFMERIVGWRKSTCPGDMTNTSIR
jgi:hypothetical protein